MPSNNPPVEVAVSAWAVRIDGKFVGSVYINAEDFHATTGTGGLSGHYSTREDAVAAIVDYHTTPAKYENEVVYRMAIAMCERSNGKGAWDSTSKGDQDFFIADARAARAAMRADA